MTPPTTHQQQTEPPATDRAPGVQPSTDSRLVREYLRRVRPHLPLRERHDIVRELESNILDRVDFLSTTEARPVDDEMFERALSELGPPESVAAAYVQDRYLVAPEAFRPFLIYTCMAFAVHLVLLGVATATGKALHVGLFPIWPVGEHGILSLLSAVSHALLLDVGLAAVLFGFAGALRRNVRTTKPMFAVDASARQSAGRGILALLVAAVLAFYRDKLFVVWSDGAPHALITDWGEAVLPLVIALLIFAAVKDLLYLCCGESRMTVATDGIHGFTGLALCLYLVAGSPVLGIPELENSEAFREPVNAFLGQLCTLVVVVGAVLFAVKTLRRAARLAML